MLSEDDGGAGNGISSQEGEREVSVLPAVRQRLVALLHRTGRREGPGCKWELKSTPRDGCIHFLEEITEP